MRALVVDDSPAARKLQRRMLERLGVDVVEAEDGLVAIGIIRDGEKFDFILLDWNMPVMDGLQFAKLLRGEGHLGVPVLMVTSETDHKRLARALLAGIDEYLMKPIDEHMLRDRLSVMGVKLTSPA